MLRPALFFLVFFTSQFSDGRLVEKTIASVDEESILLSDTRLLKKRLAAGLEPQTLLFEIFPKSILLKSQTARKEFLVYKALLNKEASKSHKTINTQNEIKKIQGKLSNKIFALRLKKQGLDMTSLIQLIAEAKQQNQAIRQKIASQIIISENDISAYHASKTGRSLYKDFLYEVFSLKVSSKQAQKFQNMLKENKPTSLKAWAKTINKTLKKQRLKGSDINQKFKQILNNLSVSEISPLIKIENQNYFFQLIWKQPLLNKKLQHKKQQISQLLWKKELKQELKKWFKETSSYHTVQLNLK